MLLPSQALQIRGPQRKEHIKTGRSEEPGQKLKQAKVGAWMDRLNLGSPGFLCLWMAALRCWRGLRDGDWHLPIIAGETVPEVTQLVRDKACD
jgi:hypothetical protein